MQASVSMEELMRIRPEFEEIAKMRQDEAEYWAVYSEVTDWNNISTFRQVSLIASTCCMLVSLGIFVFLDSICFRQFAISNKIDDPFDKNGLAGNVFNLVKGRASRASSTVASKPGGGSQAASASIGLEPRERGDLR